MSFLRNRTVHKLVVLLGGLVAIWLSHSAVAIDQLNLTIEKLESEGWRAQQLQFNLDWQVKGKTGYRLEIGRLELPQLQQSLTGLKIDCRDGSVSDTHIICNQGEAHLPLKQLQKPGFGLSFELDRETGKVEGQLTSIALAGGRVQLDLSLDGASWTARVLGRKLNLESLVNLLPIDQAPLSNWSYAGLIDFLDIRLSGKGDQLLGGFWKADFSSLAFSDATGESAGEGLTGEIKGNIKRPSGRWQVVSDVSFEQGEMLTPYFYLNAGVHRLSLETRFSLDNAWRQMLIEQSSLIAEGLLNLALEGNLDFSSEQPVKAVQLDVVSFLVEPVYRELLQPVLFGTPWDRFELAGAAELSMSMTGGEWDLDLQLKDFYLDDAEEAGISRRMGVYGVNGELHWSRGKEPEPSWIDWQSGHLLGTIDLGAARVNFEVGDDGFRLTEPAELPLFDGAVQVERLDIDDLGTLDQKLLFDGTITPISMSLLSEALGWVPLSGKLSGMIPGLTYSKGLFELDGVLLVRIFDGDILIKGLQSQDLFGIYPQLSADIEIAGLDLETLTSTFSFGKITGRLDGYLRDLRLEAWQPVTFDARFFTPEKDKSRRRISQKAVDNISNLGGAGLSGSVARSFLGFFEEFAYKRIGIGCRLQDGTCEMVGVGKAKQGYYLVEGGGIPRIDIIGYNRTADWEQLLEQLKQITESEGPVIQ